MGFQFHETVRGKNFYEHQLPALINAVEQLAEAIKNQLTETNNDDMPQKSVNAGDDDQSKVHGEQITEKDWKLLCYKANATQDEILYVRVPNNTPDKLLYEANELLNKRMEEYADENDNDFSEFDFRQEIFDALEKMRINHQGLNCHITFYI